jgi:flagellar hook-basal body complex protein FliE
MAIAPVEGPTISMLQPHAPVEGAVAPVPEQGEAEGVPFSSLFVDAVAKANAMGNEAHQATLDLAAGRSDDIHGTMIEVQKAGIQMRLVNNVRNKVIDAFYELWRMNV